MRLEIPRGIRYQAISLIEGKPPVWLALPIRMVIFLAMILILAPWKALREVTLGPAYKSDLKSSFRSMLWVWNRSWLPVRFNLGTFFDIGWVLSQESCDGLVRRRFVSKTPLKQYCDLGQLQLSSLRKAVEDGNRQALLASDQKLCELVETVLNGASNQLQASRYDRDVKAAAPSPQKQKVPRPKQHFNNDRTRTALLEFDDLSRQLALPYFLVSGTFLGVVRDGAFIGHDHDIDLGLFEEDVSESLLLKLLESRNFQVTEVDHICLRQKDASEVQYGFMPRPAIIRLAHRNGISIDLFVHFREKGVLWHGSSVHRWNNSDFELMDYPFLGRSFKGAADYDRYLNENYGSDWRVPKTEFNVNFDTPNLTFVGTANALVYFAWMIEHVARANDFTAVATYINMLLELGVVERRDGLLVIC